MAKKKVDPKSNPNASRRDDQPYLIDVQSPSAKALRPLARKLKDAQDQHGVWHDAAKDLKDKMLKVIDEDATIKCDAEGIKRVSFEGVTITVKPTSQKIEVKIKEEESEEDSD